MATKTPRTTVKDYLHNVNTEDAVSRILRRRSVAGDPEGDGDSVAKSAPGSADKQQRKRMEAGSPHSVNSGTSSIASDLEEEVTPRHIIQNMLMVQDTAQPVTRRRKRMSDVIMPPPPSTGGHRSAKRRHSSLSIELEDIMRKHTPRTNIGGLLDQVPEETPAVRKRISGTDSSSTAHLGALMVNEVGVSLLENRSGGSGMANVLASGSRFRGKKGNLTMALPQASAATPSQVQQTPELRIRSRTSTPRKDKTVNADDHMKYMSPVLPAISPVSDLNDGQSEGDMGKDVPQPTPADCLDKSGTSEGDRSKGSDRNVFSDILGEHNMDCVENNGGADVENHVDMPEHNADVEAHVDMPEQSADVEAHVDMPEHSSAVEVEQVQGGYKVHTSSAVAGEVTPTSDRRHTPLENSPQRSAGKMSTSGRSLSMLRQSDVEEVRVGYKAQTSSTVLGEVTLNVDGTLTVSEGSLHGSGGKRSSSRRSLIQLRQSVVEGVQTPSAVTGEMTPSNEGRDDDTHTPPESSHQGSAGKRSSSRRNLSQLRQSDEEEVQGGSKRQTPSAVAGEMTPSNEGRDDGTHTPSESSHQGSAGKRSSSRRKLAQLSLRQCFSRIASPADQGASPGPHTDSSTGKKTPAASSVSSSTSSVTRSSRRRISLSMTAPEEQAVLFSSLGHQRGGQSTSRTGEQSLADGGDHATSAPSPSLAVNRLSSRVENQEVLHSGVRSDHEAALDVPPEEDDYGASVFAGGMASMPDSSPRPSDLEESSDGESLSPLKTPHLPEKQRTPHTALSRLGARNRTLDDQPRAQTAGANKGGRVSGPRRRKPSQGLPTSVVKATFSHFCQLRVAKEAIEEVEKMSEQFWKNMAEDLEAYANHAHRKTINETDVELLMKRQGFITDTCSLNTLIAKHLPLELRQQLIPMARSGNKLEPSP